MNFSDDTDFSFAPFDRPAKMRLCDCPGCGQAGDFRAPKGRDQLNEYYWFCLFHVREYNQAWDFFAGMSEAEIEARIRDATVWERPSWPLGEWKKREKELRDRVAADFFGESAAPDYSGPPTPAFSLAERDAFRALELTETYDFAVIKAQYRTLVKLHHPDANGGSAEAEERFKIINQAYAVLRAAYGMGEAE